jgi:RNA polymerase sigma factor (sigma-70 family)
VSRIPDRLEALLPELQRFCARLPAAPQLRDEVFSESLVVLARNAEHLQSLNDEEAVRWVRGVAFLVARNEQRASNRRSRLLQHIVALTPNLGLDMSDVGAASEELSNAVGKLSKIDRSLLVAQVWEQRSTAELAEQFGLSESAVRVRLSRARQVVRQEMFGTDVTNGGAPDIH